MSFNFAPTANQQPKIDLIPAGTPVLTIVSVSEIKRSSNSGCLQAKLEFTIARGPYERRKVWMYIGDPNDPNCSEKWKPMCLANLQHMLESAGIFDPTNVDTYTRYATVPPEHAFTTILQDLDGKHVAVKLKIEKGTDGNDDRNTIGMILSPNPNGRTAKAYEGIKNGDDLKVTPPSPAAAAANAFGAAAPAATPATGGFANAPAQATTAAQPAAATAAAPSWLGQ